MSTFYPENDYRTYLAHYGVKGMKWGVRHDPVREGRRKKRINNLLTQTTNQAVIHTTKKSSPKNLEDDDWKIDSDSITPDRVHAEKKYENGMRAWISAYKDTPNILDIAKNLNKINSDINRLRLEFAKINYSNDKNDGVPEGYPKDYAEQNKKAFLNREDVLVMYKDTRKYVPEYKNGTPDDLYEMSMWSPVDGLEYVLPISQNEYGHFYIDPKSKPEYR